MELTEIRSSFQVFVYSGERRNLNEVSRWVESWGFQNLIIEESLDLFEKIKSSPPHIMIVSYDVNEVDLIESFKKVSPETHIIFLSQTSDFSSAVLNKMVYDVIEWPMNSPVQLLRVLDHIVERDYYFYKSEQIEMSMGGAQSNIEDLNQRIVELDEENNTKKLMIEELKKKYNEQKSELNKKSFLSPENVRFWNEFVGKLLLSTHFDDSVQAYMEAVSKKMNDCEAYYFKYVPAHKSLLLSKSIRSDQKTFNGLGVELKSIKNLHIALRNPSEILSIKNFVEKALGHNHFVAETLCLEDTVVGVFVFNTVKVSEELTIYRQYFEGSIYRHYFHKRLHELSHLDPVTRVLKRENFTQKLSHEVSRSRRIERPVSLLLVKVDQYNEFLEYEGREEAHFLIRMIARVIEENTRVNDVIGSITSSELGVILPHTDFKGASIHAERLRKIIESADFSKIIMSNPSITVSVGVSEYPSFSKDCDELFETSDQALYMVQSQGSNQVCLADAKLTI